MLIRACKALIGLGGLPAYQTLSNSEGSEGESGSEGAGANIRVRALEQQRPPNKVPKCRLSGKRCGAAQTARRLA